MNWFGSKSKSNSFSVENVEFSLPNEIMEKSEVHNSGLGLIARNEGFKEIPPQVERSKSGVIVLQRPLKSFELMIRHLSGEQPLKALPVSKLADEYIALKSELKYWALPIGDALLPRWIWTKSAWTDETCFYPISKSEKGHDELVQVSAPTIPMKMIKLEKCAALPEEMKSFFEENEQTKSFQALPSPNTKITVSAGGNRLICKMPKMKNPCIIYGNYPEDPKFVPFVFIAAIKEYTLVWTKGIFFYIRIAEDGRVKTEVVNEKPSWLCVHPTCEMLLSGIKGPIPFVQCFNMPNAGVVRFFPWGATVVAEEIELPPKEPSIETETESPAAETPRGLGEAIYETLAAGKEPSQHPSRAACLVKVIRRFSGEAKTYITSIYVRQDDKYKDVSLKLSLRKDYEVIDNRLDNGNFRTYVLLKGCLAYKQTDDKGKDTPNSGTGVIILNGSTVNTSQSGLSIHSGGPTEEILFHGMLYGEYRIAEDTYYTYTPGKAVYDYHKSLYQTEAAEKDSDSNCYVQ